MKSLKPLSYLTLPTAFLYLVATLFTLSQYYRVAKAFTTYGVSKDLQVEHT
jgi:hypothetical protein